MAVGTTAVGVVGSAMANRGGGKSAQQQQTTETVPWEEAQPYLIGDGLIPSYLTQMPRLNSAWLQWAQNAGTGADYRSAPPPMMYDSIRAQQGIGDVGAPVGMAMPSNAQQPAGISEEGLLPLKKDITDLQLAMQSGTPLGTIQGGRGWDDMYRGFLTMRGNQ
jgi:hypothetical protein